MKSPWPLSFMACTSSTQSKPDRSDGRPARAGTAPLTGTAALKPAPLPAQTDSAPPDGVPIRSGMPSPVTSPTAVEAGDRRPSRCPAGAGARGRRCRCRRRATAAPAVSRASTSPKPSRLTSPALRSGVHAGEGDAGVDRGAELEGVAVGDDDELLARHADQVRARPPTMLGAGDPAHRLEVRRRAERGAVRPVAATGQQHHVAVGGAGDQVGAAVAVEVAGDEAVVAAPRAGDLLGRGEAAGAVAGLQQEPVLGAQQQVGAAVAVDVAGTDELPVVAVALAGGLAVEAAPAGREQGGEAALEAGDQVVAAVAVDVADRGDQRVAAQRQLLGGPAELAVAAARPGCAPRRTCRR